MRIGHVGQHKTIKQQPGHLHVRGSVEEDALLGEEGLQVGLSTNSGVAEWYSQSDDATSGRVEGTVPNIGGGKRMNAVRLDSDAVPRAGLGRVEAEPSPLEGMHFKAAVKVMHAFGGVRMYVSSENAIASSLGQRSACKSRSAGANAKENSVGICGSPWLG